MSGVRVEAQEAGCRMSGGQVGGEFIPPSNQKRLPPPLFDPLFGVRLMMLLILKCKTINNK